jgi:serine/threonine-protein kinase
VLTIGQQVDRYVVEGKLGEGGIATVYRVRHETLGTVHALKTLQFVGSEIRGRLLREGKLQARLIHPNVVQVTDVLTIQSFPSLLMELVEGPSLESWLTRYQPTVDEAMALFRGVCLGVGFAHVRGVIHRDLKPPNVLLAVEEDRVVPKVADFGLAKELRPTSISTGGHTKVGQVMGTPGYMAPEQTRDSSDVDRRADLWALGCLLYRLTVGVAPFEGDDVPELFAQVTSGDYVPSRRIRPDLPDRIHVAIERLLQVDARNRPADVGALVEYLDGIRDELPQRSQPTDPCTLPVTAEPSWLALVSEGGALAVQMTEEARASLPKLERGKPPKPVKVRKRPSRASEAPTVTNEPDPPLASAPTEAPAPARMLDPAPEEVVTRQRTSGVLMGAALMGAIAIGALLLAIGAIGMVAIVQAGRSNPVAPPIPVVAAPPPPLAAPTPARTDVPAPPPPRPSPTGPTPAPPRPAPEPEAPSGGTARVTFTGADALWLETLDADKVEVKNLAAVPPGRYRILATFPGLASSGAGEIKLAAGDRVHLTCVVEMAQCRPTAVSRAR